MINLAPLKPGDKVRVVRRDGRVFIGRLHRYGVDSIVLDVSISPRSVRDGRQPHLIRIAREAVVEFEPHNPSAGFCD